MSIEYHGWVALATSQNDWCDGDFEEGFSQVREALQSLRPEDGHDAVMPEKRLSPQIAYFNGDGAKSLAPVLRAIEAIGAIFDRAYGELVVFDDNGDQNRRWSFSGAARYRLLDGKLTRLSHPN